ncbi:DNA-binding protein with HTH domain [Neorhizobium galegae bv. orientalis]|nr:DNA-binding protein with HTH domain [Neorhizobium galegae bv. orientalis]
MVAISDIIGLIYDCVIDPGNWQATMETIRTELNFCYAILAAYPLPAGSVQLSVAVGTDPAWLARLPAYGEDIVTTWGGNERILQFPLEEPILQSHAVSPASLETSCFVQEWIKPQGVIDAIAIGLERNDRMVSTLSLGRHNDAGAVTELELACLRIIAPHIRRALAISQLLEIKTIEVEKFTAVLGGMTSAVLIVDEERRIIHTNSAAQSMLRAGEPIFMRSGQVRVHSAASDLALDRVIRKLAKADGPVTESGSGIPAPRDEGLPCVIHVLPLRHSKMSSVLEDRSVAALFIADAAHTPRLPTEALGVVYGLTPAEMRIFEFIVEGKSLKSIATILGVANSTVKTHLLRVFAKTDCARQSDLVRLALRLTSQVATTARP